MLLLGEYNYDEESAKTYGAQAAVEKGHCSQQGLVPQPLQSFANFHAQLTRCDNSLFLELYSNEKQR